MTTIVDASVALKWVCAEEGSDRAVTLLDGRPLAAPAFWLVETANVLWRRVQSQELSRVEADEMIAVLISAPVEALDVGSMVAPALTIACDLGHPVYDCLYLAAAIKKQGNVVTADRRFHAVASRHPYFRSSVTLL